MNVRPETNNIQQYISNKDYDFKVKLKKCFMQLHMMGVCLLRIICLIKT